MTEDGEDVRGGYKKITPVDRHIAMRIRLGRSMRRMNQADLAKAVGVSFQQMQKYEKAQNRVTAATIYELALALDVAPAFFFEGLHEDRLTSISEDAVRELINPDTVPVLELYAQLSTDQQSAVRRVMELMGKGGSG